MTRPGRQFAVVILAAMALAAEPAAADVRWSWEFGSESGIFVTDGTFADTAGVFVFTFESFSVAASTIPGNVGATYVDEQAPSTMSWNGSVPTQFARANGALTNGSNFDRADAAYQYSLDVTGGLLESKPDDTDVVMGALTVRPLPDVAPSVEAPLLSSAALALLLVLLAATGVLSRHRRSVVA